MIARDIGLFLLVPVDDVSVLLPLPKKIASRGPHKSDIAFLIRYLKRGSTLLEGCSRPRDLGVGNLGLSKSSYIKLSIIQETYSRK